MKELFILNEELKGFSSVIIYGTGNAGRGIFLKLLQRNVKVDCFIDSYPENCGSAIFGVPVHHIREISGKTDSAIIVGGRYTFPVAAELKKFGYDHIFYDLSSEAEIIHLERDGYYAD